MRYSNEFYFATPGKGRILVSFGRTREERLCCRDLQLNPTIPSEGWASNSCRFLLVAYAPVVPRL
jgi:hypothetical protein